MKKASRKADHENYHCVIGRVVDGMGTSDTILEACAASSSIESYHANQACLELAEAA